MFSKKSDTIYLKDTIHLKEKNNKHTFSRKYPLSVSEVGVYEGHTTLIKTVQKTCSKDNTNFLIQKHTFRSKFDL